MHANSEMIRCNWGINDYRSFMELPDSEYTTDKENQGSFYNERKADQEETSKNNLYQKWDR